VWEMSADGLSLGCLEALAAGRRFVLDLPRPVLCEVAHCRAQAGGYRIGAKLIDFMDRLGEDELVAQTSLQTTAHESTTVSQNGLVLHKGREEMSTSVQSQLPPSLQQWLSQGETLYSGMVREFQTLQDKVAELEASIQQKATEVNQIAQLLGKPAVQSSKISAELVTHYSPELRTNDEALRIRIPSATRPAVARPAKTIDAVATGVR
ncbi:MAG TPA: hypothetical protein VN541_21125, partial [Tepidisphaeraceae bacterium]|nr:hypothetical protein [Tepidisphaeraceae bacterium]